jgi:hypothetical protein
VKDDKWNDPVKAMLTPRYILFVLVANLFLMAGIIGVLPEKMGMANVFGGYYNVMHANWMGFVVAAVVVGLLNYILMRRNQSKTQN